MQSRSDTVFYHGGRYYDSAEGMIFPNDRGFTLGDGCFETICIREKRAVFLSDHLSRLSLAMQILKINKPIDMDHIEMIIEKLCATAHRADGVVRVTISRGQSERGLKIDPKHEASLVVAFGKFPPQKPYIKSIISSFRRNADSPLSRIKAIGSYQENILAMDEALSYGADDAIMCNHHGRPTCFTIGNLLIETADKQYFTPPPSEGCIEGITLKNMSDRILDYRPITIDMLKTARKVYRTNAVAGLVEVTLIGNEGA
ncbi:MAG: aminotransferase class IV [Pseudomonadota bacterium]